MEITKIPCFLCGQTIEVKNSKKGKPYFICDSCGLQAFIRRTKGIDRLKEWMEGKGEVFKKKSGGELLTWVSEMETLKGKLKEVEGKRGLFPDEDTKLIVAAIKKEIEGVKGRIKAHMKGKGN